MEPGDHLDQKTFHARYEAMPEDVRAELIGGVVYMPSPLKLHHGRIHARLIHWLGTYKEATPGVEVADNTTLILGPYSEPQPDAFLAISPLKGGRTRLNEDGYLEGPPELIAEIATSTECYNLHSKKDGYEQAGVKEYLVVALRQRKVFWFLSRNGRFEELTLGKDNIFHSEIFPGLWLDPNALLNNALLNEDTTQLLVVLRKGLDTPEHAAFVARLT